ncbi:FAD:protein FMN transferase, partial [Rhizobium ruizarguesonis]
CLRKRTDRPRLSASARPCAWPRTIIAVAKGYGADQLADAARQHGIDAGLFAIDGELRALGTRSDGRGWAVAVETPNLDVRAVHSMLELDDA